MIKYATMIIAATFMNCSYSAQSFNSDTISEFLKKVEQKAANKMSDPHYVYRFVFPFSKLLTKRIIKKHRSYYDKDCAQEMAALKEEWDQLSLFKKMKLYWAGTSYDNLCDAGFKIYSEKIYSIYPLVPPLL